MLTLNPQCLCQCLITGKKKKMSVFKFKCSYGEEINEILLEVTEEGRFQQIFNFLTNNDLKRLNYELLMFVLLVILQVYVERMIFSHNNLSYLEKPMSNIKYKSSLLQKNLANFGWQHLQFLGHNSHIF